MSLRRYYHRHFGHHERFHLAVIFTIIVVAYVVVPIAVRYIEALQGYSPHFYEPKDLERQEWLRRTGVPNQLAGLSWDVVVNTVLLILVAVVWLTLVPTRASRRRRVTSACARLGRPRPGSTRAARRSASATPTSSTTGRSRTRSSRATRGTCPAPSTSGRCAGRSLPCAAGATSAPSAQRRDGRRIPCATCGRSTSCGAGTGSPCSFRPTAFSIIWRGTSSAARSPSVAAPASPTGSARCWTRATGASQGRRPRRTGSRWSGSSIRARRPCARERHVFDGLATGLWISARTGAMNGLTGMLKRADIGTVGRHRVDVDVVGHGCAPVAERLSSPHAARSQT